MDFLGFTYVEIAVGASILAAMTGLLYSLVDVGLKTKQDGKAKWQPLPYMLGFAIFWPAFLFLFPFFIFDNVLARAVRSEEPWAVRLSNKPSYRFVGQLVLGLGFGIMCCYAVGFFL